MRGKEIKAVAKRNIGAIIKKGEPVTIQSILYDEPHLLVNAIGGRFDKDGKLLRLTPCYKQIADKEVGVMIPIEGSSHGDMMAKVYEPSYAPAGSYKSSVIITESGHEMPSSLLMKPLAEYFEKVKN